jgi:hypothetical protein
VSAFSSCRLLPRICQYYRAAAGRLVGAVLGTAGQKMLLISAYMPSGLDHTSANFPIRCLQADGFTDTYRALHPYNPRNGRSATFVQSYGPRVSVIAPEYSDGRLLSFSPCPHLAFQTLYMFIPLQATMQAACLHCCTVLWIIERLSPTLKKI